MAHGIQEFALVGYSDELERRPLKFVEPIPASRICSACVSIPRVTYTLMCGHTFCEPCYESCATTSECVCPLDGDVSVTDDVSSKRYPAENLLRRKVHCWNEANGCGVVLPAEHARHDCRHHVTRCPTCLGVVLCRDVCAHLKARCTALVLHAPPEQQQETYNNEKAQLVAFEKKMQLRVRELDAKLAQLSLESTSQSDKLIGLCHNSNHLKEALTEQFGPGLDRKVAGIEALYTEKSESLMSAITSVFESVQGGQKTHQQVITGYAALKEKALKRGFCRTMGDKVYLRRYLLSWGILFKKEGDNVNLFLRIQLHKGKGDDFLDWPFEKELKLSIIHPDTLEERMLRETTNVTGVDRKFYARPIEANNPTVYFSDTKVESSDIEGDDYVKGDQLFVRLEVSF